MSTPRTVRRQPLGLASRPANVLGGCPAARRRVLPAARTADDKRTCLHLAASEGNKPLVECLLGLKAHMNAKDRFGTPALSYPKPEP